MASSERNGQPGLQPGTQVEVLTKFSASWTSGFEVAAVDRAGYIVRRHSDGSVLPVTFTTHQVRPRR